jgi:hypothetical protein
MRPPCGELDEFAVDAPVAPRRVLLVEAENEPADLAGGRRPTGSARRSGPVACHEAAMPGQHGLRLNDQEHLAESGTVEHLGEHAEHEPVAVGEPRTGHLPLEDEDLVTKGQDLGVTTVAAREEEAESGDHEADDERQRPEHGDGPYPARTPH